MRANRVRGVHAAGAPHPASRSSSSRPRPRRWKRRCGSRSTRLAPLAPNFVSVTYGAGGSTRERTHATVKRILDETALTPRPRISPASPRRATRSTPVIRDYRDGRRAPHRGAARRSGRRHRREIRAASGRLSATAPISSPASSALRRHRGVGLGLSGKASGQPDASRPTSTCSKAKVDAGATRAITQFFFENDLYFRYLDRVRARGIDIPIVPGILPVQNFKQTKSFAARCGATVPAWLAERFDGLDDDAGDPQADRRRGRRRAGARSGRSRRHRLSFLHHEPRRSGLRDLPSAGAAALRRQQGSPEQEGVQ